MDSYPFDVVVAGGGLAGFQAAVNAASQGQKIRVALLTTASENSYGGCSFKTHGTNAAMNPGDSPADHERDTLAGGGGINDRILVRTLAERVPDEIRRMELRGVRFDKAADGKYATGYYGGSTTARSIHKRDMAGRHMVDALVAEAQIEGVHVFNDRQAVQFDVRDNRCHGVYVVNKQSGQSEHFSAPNTISALGGGACAYPISTISKDKTAAGIVQAFEAGAELTDMEMVQFHPTGLNKPGRPGHGEILEEELRSMGAQFRNAAGHRYMFDYDNRGERATRDVVSRATYIEIRQNRGTASKGVFLDFSEIDRNSLLSRFPFMAQRLRSFGVDIGTCTSVETSPAAHFLMGGVRIDRNAKSTIDGLYACGEDAGGIHGGNRLGGNGVADALVFGAIAGRAAAASGFGTKSDVTKLGNSVRAIMGLDEMALARHMHRLEQGMWIFVGPVRNADGLRKAEMEILKIIDSVHPYISEIPLSQVTAQIIPGRVAFQKLTLALMIVRSAQERGNSVGSHYREDCDGNTAVYNVTLTQGPDRLPNVSKSFPKATPSSAPSTEVAA